MLTTVGPVGLFVDVGAQAAPLLAGPRVGEERHQHVAAGGDAAHVTHALVDEGEAAGARAGRRQVTAVRLHVTV